MKTDSSGTFNALLLPGTILLAKIDVNGLLAYGIKAAIGGAIWLVYKVIAERLESGRKSEEKRNKKTGLKIIKGNKEDQ